MRGQRRKRLWLNRSLIRRCLHIIVGQEMKIITTAYLLTVVGCAHQSSDSDELNFRNLTASSTTRIQREEIARSFPVAKNQGILPINDNVVLFTNAHEVEAWKLPSGRYLIAEDETQLIAVVDLVNNPKLHAPRTVSSVSGLRLVSADGGSIVSWCVPSSREKKLQPNK